MSAVRADGAVGRRAAGAHGRARQGAQDAAAEAEEEEGRGGRKQGCNSIDIFGSCPESPNHAPVLKGFHSWHPKPQPKS